jgi:hypothetical protein
MSVHIHAVRTWCARAFLLVPTPLLLSWVWAPESKDFKLVQVSGQVTCTDQPFSGTIFFVPVDEGGTDASGLANRDGSFQLYANGRWDQPGALPGTYRVFVRPRVSDQTESLVDRKYLNPGTTDLLVNVGSDWNYVHLDLH